MQQRRTWSQADGHSFLQFSAISCGLPCSSPGGLPAPEAPFGRGPWGRWPPGEAARAGGASRGVR
eukprot:13998076-Alexandrium_andersonii.AAC.1